MTIRAAFRLLLLSLFSLSARAAAMAARNAEV